MPSFPLGVIASIVGAYFLKRYAPRFKKELSGRERGEARRNLSLHNQCYTKELLFEKKVLDKE